jgi:hypothetical protein
MDARRAIWLQVQTVRSRLSTMKSNQFAVLGFYFPDDGRRYALMVLLGPGENIEARSDRYPQASTAEILGLYEPALLPSLRTGLLIQGRIRRVDADQFSVSYP